MSKREYRKFTLEQKQEVLKLAEQPGVTITEVCRKYGLSVSVFYRWRAVSLEGSTAALKSEGKKSKASSEASALARRDAELDRLRAVIAEITAENLELKKKI